MKGKKDMNKIYVLLKLASGSYIICEETEYCYRYIQHVHNPKGKIATKGTTSFQKDENCIEEVVRTSSTLDIEEFTQICMLEIL